MLNNQLPTKIHVELQDSVNIFNATPEVVEEWFRILLLSL
jgi:hypothetical protein